MANKKAAHEIKRLKKKAKEATAANLTLEKQVRKLKKKLRARKQRIADLQGRSSPTSPITEVTDPAADELGDHGETNIASSLRSAWRQHSYLRDRYEYHLGSGATKGRARQLANEDLQQAYGPGSGYTDEELGAILS